MVFHETPNKLFGAPLLKQQRMPIKRNKKAGRNVASNGFGDVNYNEDEDNKYNYENNTNENELLNTTKNRLVEANNDLLHATALRQSDKIINHRSRGVNHSTLKQKHKKAGGPNKSRLYFFVFDASSPRKDVRYAMKEFGFEVDLLFTYPSDVTKQVGSRHVSLAASFLLHLCKFVHSG